MKRVIHVYLGHDARRVGTLYYDGVGSRERSAFAYEETWLGAADRFSLEPGLPLVAGSQFHRKSRAGSVFHAAFADTEPDGWAKRVILRDHAKQRQASRRSGKEPESAQLNALDFLLAVNDTSRVGALRLQDEKGVFCRRTESGSTGAPPFLEPSRLLSATRAVEMENETASDLAYLRGRGTSLGGMRPKFSEETGPEATIEALLSVTAYFRISSERAKEILGKIEYALSDWRKKGRELGMTNHEVEQYADAFEHPARKAAQKAMIG